MGKIIFMALIAALAWVFFKKRAVEQSRPKDKVATDASSSVASAAIERMVACADCGVFMPESDSVLREGKISCRDPGHCAHRNDSSHSR